MNYMDEGWEDWILTLLDDYKSSAKEVEVGAIAVNRVNARRCVIIGTALRGVVVQFSENRPPTRMVWERFHKNYRLVN